MGLFQIALAAEEEGKLQGHLRLLFFLAFLPGMPGCSLQFFRHPGKA